MFVAKKIFSKCSHQFVNHLKYSTRTSAWQISSYGGLEELQYNDNVKLPDLKPKDVIVEMRSISVNPIDVAMIGGYGSVVLNALRQLETCSCDTNLEFPITLGRDFSGQIVAKGVNVKDFQIGDLVYGVIQPHKQGSFSKLILADSHLIHKKPNNLTDAQSAGLLYTGLTAWSALQITAALGLVYPKNKKVLVLGGSGGVGNIAVQLLKAWDIDVVTTCCTDAKDLVTKLDANLVVDYTQPDAIDSILQAGPYDVILDAAGVPLQDINTYLPLLKSGKFSKFVTLRSPFLKNTDEFGLVPGVLKNLFDLLKSNLESGELKKTNTIRWGFFMPISFAIKEINKFIERDQIKVLIDSEYKFHQLPEAIEKVKKGHLRGKVIVSV